MKVTYIGTPDDEVTTAVSLFGVEFPKGEAVDVSGLDEASRGLLSGNPTFLAEEAGPADHGVEIPADWSEAHWKTRCALASRISGSMVLTAAEAGEIIEAELARRAAPAEAEKPATEPMPAAPTQAEPAAEAPAAPEAPQEAEKPA